MKVHDTPGITMGREMESLSTTRWSCRFKNCESVMSNYNVITEVLKEEVSHARGKNAVDALGILGSMRKPDFIVSSLLFHRVLTIVNVRSKYFQCKDAILDRAGEIINSVIATFEQSRDDFHNLWDEIKDFADRNEISLEPMKVSEKRKQPERI